VLATEELKLLKDYVRLSFLSTHRNRLFSKAIDRVTETVPTLDSAMFTRHELELDKAGHGARTSAIRVVAWPQSRSNAGLTVLAGCPPRDRPSEFELSA
jgi:hypothetical protein